MTKNYDNCVIDGDSSGLLRSLGQSYKLGYPAESIRRVYSPITHSGYISGLSELFSAA